MKTTHRISVNIDKVLTIRSNDAPIYCLVCTSPTTGTHSVWLRDPNADEYVGMRYGRALVHMIGFLERNHVEHDEIARLVTHICQDTLDGFSPSMTFCHAEFRRGVLAAWGLGKRSRKYADNYETAGWKIGRLLRPYVTLPVNV